MGSDLLYEYSSWEPKEDYKALKTDFSYLIIDRFGYDDYTEDMLPDHWEKLEMAVKCNLMGSQISE